MVFAIAVPNDPPICWDVVSTADAAPVSCGRTLKSAVESEAGDDHGGHDASHVGAVDFDEREIQHAKGGHQISGRRQWARSDLGEQLTRHSRREDDADRERHEQHSGLHR